MPPSATSAGGDEPARRPDVEVVTVAVVAAAAALLAARAGCRPTGVPGTDAALTALLAVAVVVVGRRARPLGLATTAAVAVVASGGGAALVAGLAGLALTGAVLLLDRRGWDPGTVRSTTAGLAAATTLQGLLRLTGPEPARASAAVAAVALVPLAWSGWRRLEPPLRRAGRWVLGGVAAVAVLGAATGAAAGAVAVLAIRDGVEATDDGLAAVREGDQEAAGGRFRAAADDLGSARDATRAWWALPARHVPLVSQQVAALDAVADAGATTAELAVASSDGIDAERLRLVDGRLDPQVVVDAQPALRAMAEGTADVRADLADVPDGSTWHLPPVADGLDRFADAMADAESSARTGALAAEVGPELLGRDGVARYFIAFVSPSEARGTGFLGSYGLLTVTDGTIELTEVGRNDELDAAGVPGRRISGPAEYLERYGRFAPESTWENVTFTPDWPTAGQVIAELYPQSGGVEVDGVIRVDPTGLSRLLRATGPVEVEGLPYPLDATNVEGFLEVEQYRLFQVAEERSDLLGQVGARVFEVLTTGRGPAPAALARTLGPAVEGDHLSVWMRSPRAQELIERLGATGAVPPVVDDGFGVITQNGGGGKVDVYLHRSVTYEATVDARTGAVGATATVVLENRAPTAGEPPYLIGNLVDEPVGTNRSWVSLYSPLELRTMAVDGTDIDPEQARELGRNVWTALLDVPPGGSVTIVVELEGAVDLSDGRYRLDVLGQPVVNPDRVDVAVEVVGGDVEVVAEGRAPDGGVTVQGSTIRASARATDGPWTAVAGVVRR